MSIRRRAFEVLFSVSMKIKWQFLSHIRRWKGINTYRRDLEVIVSLTSFPPRINAVVETIKSLLMQNFKPDHVVLWLAYSQFPDGETSLPNQLIDLKKYGLDIEWCEDLKSYKKLIPSIKKYPDSIIVTTDDDILYRSHWLSKLYNGYQKNNRAIWAHRVTKIDYENGEYITHAGGLNRWPNYSYLNKITGCGGVLYPPNVFDSEILKSEIFQVKCPTNDDIWFWLMAVRMKIKVGVPDNPDLRLVYVNNTQEGEALTKINDHGEHLFWKDFKSVLNEYPSIEELLKEELINRKAEK